MNQREAEDHFAVQAGLNLHWDDIFTAFSKPGAFKELTELSFANATIRNFDIVHIHHLPKLSILNLDHTGIGNEGVYLLIPLKYTLTQLHLANNVDIDNNAAYALMLFKRLAFLSIHDTAIDMVGVRQIALALEEDKRDMILKIPFICQEYLNTIDSKYFVDAAPPLIVNEHLCSQLSASTLKRNLEAHAVYNPTILSVGTRPELVFRLTELLRTRRLDKLVLKMVEAQDCDKENNPLEW
ncbi:hypothetical protein CPB83DRAFT_771417 [Crepidotus variabilis]|uniref:Uncharacterized protein n=1 Tax=Crepidotus variabilis TaxID=179855 RepID=A0A9P6JMM3_9AGAR|nr:hypothetical protein CPB83DRAFT_771417 [Crepidotus variabilis]